MRKQDYEAMVILKTAGTEQEIEKAASQLEEPIKKLGGDVTRAQSMGRRRLAFKISKQNEGYYHLLRFSAPTGSIQELDKAYRLNDRIVRFVILNGDEVASQDASAPAATQAAVVTRA